LSRERLAKVQQVLALRQPDLTVVMDGVHKPHNVAAIVRSCDAVGVMEVHLVRPRDRKLGDRLGTPHATSGGSQKWVQQRRYEGVTEPIRQLQSMNFQVLAANKSARAVDFRQVDFTKPTAILMGAELFGVGEEALGLVDREIFIPMVGMVESFNVSVACAVLLAEAQRQRLAAGHYDQPKLTQEQLNRMCFEWLHPKLAALYQRQGKNYPLLDEDGDIVTSTAIAETKSTGVL
jgi:tRNA (guanosine-2'-O-)-methyltransferase